MNDLRQQTLMVAIILAMMCLVAGWSTMRMLDQRKDAEGAAEGLQVCQQLADQITKQQGQEELVSSNDDSASQEQMLAQRINEAATEAGLSGPWQQGIEHKREVRIDDTPYMRKPAVLITRGLTLYQLSRLLHNLTHDSPYTAEQLQIRTPPGEEAGNRWDADITLTYLIYAPQPTERSGR